MRIAQVVQAYEPFWGGAERHCKRVSEELRLLGHEVQIFTSDLDCPDYENFSAGKVSKQGSARAQEGVSRIAFGGALYGITRWVLSWKRGFRFQQYLKEKALRQIRKQFSCDLTDALNAYQPDIISVFFHAGYLTECLLSEKSKLNAPVILISMVHPGEDIEGAPEALRRLALADGIISNTEAERQRIIEAAGLAEEKTLAAAPGTDFPALEKLTDFSKRDGVLFLGRKEINKGVLALLEAMQTVWQKAPAVKWLFAGSPGTTYGQIREVLAGLSEDERSKIAIYENITEEEKADLFSRAVCLVLPSYLDSFGLVLLEAWAHGVPVITYDLEVFREIVTDGEDGILVEPSNRNALSQAILELISQSGKAQKMGALGREKIRRNYSWEKTAVKYAGFYEKIVSQRFQTAGEKKVYAKAC